MKYFSLIVEMPSGDVLIREMNIKKLALELQIGVDAMQKQLKSKGIYVCVHSGIRVKLCCIEIVEYKHWLRTKKRFCKILKK